MKKKLLTILVLLFVVVMSADAQTCADGRKVKRITFDQEKVTVEYTDGSTDMDVRKLAVKSERQATEIKTVTSGTTDAKQKWYTTDGRALQGEPRNKGVYIVRDRKGVKKSVKK